MKKIELTHGFVALVDDEDYEALVSSTWHTVFRHGLVYAATNVPRPGRGTIQMHRQIVNAGSGVHVDHLRHRIAEKVVDNRKANLRLATGTQNNANRIKKKGASSIFKGVSFCRGRWVAQIMKDYRNRYLGLYPTEALAARAHDLKAVELFGDFAFTNFPIPGSKHWIYGPGESGEGVADA